MTKRSTKSRWVPDRIRFMAPVFLILLFPLLADAESSKKEGGDAGDIGRGAIAWTENCTRCHNLRTADEYSDIQWKPVIWHMRIRAGLTGQEARDILAFYRATN